MYCAWNSEHKTWRSVWPKQQETDSTFDHASVISRKRRMVLEQSTFSGLCQCLYHYLTYLRMVAAAVVETVHAPPAMVLRHARQCQIPTAVRLTESCTKSQPSQCHRAKRSSEQNGMISRTQIWPFRRKCKCTEHAGWLPSTIAAILAYLPTEKIHKNMGLTFFTCFLSEAP